MRSLRYMMFVVLLSLLAACGGEGGVQQPQNETAPASTTAPASSPTGAAVERPADPTAEPTAEPVTASQRLLYTRPSQAARRDGIWSAPLGGGEEELVLEPICPNLPPDATCSVIALAASRDGSRVAYAVAGFPGELHLMRPDGSEDTVIAGGSTLSRGAFSPDGSRIAFLREREAGSAPVPETSIWVYDIAGDEATQLTSWRYFYGEPFWIDGETVAFSQATEGGTPPAGWMTFKVAAQEGATPEQVIQGRLLDVSPRGSDLLVALERPSGADPATSDGESTVALNLFNLERAEPSVLIGSAGPGVWAAWAPDSSSIALNAWLSMVESSLLVAGPDGSTTPLKTIPGMTMFTDMTWDQRGEQLIYAADSALWAIDPASGAERPLVESAGRFVVVVAE